MSYQQFPDITSVKPTEKEIKLARVSSPVLSDVSSKSDQITITLNASSKKQKNIILPSSALKLLVTIIHEMAAGNTVTVLPTHTELTTQEAADLLNVSRPFLIQLLETKKIPYRKVGTRRKILLHDVLFYKAKTDTARRKVLDELANESQKLNLGY